MKAIKKKAPDHLGRPPWESRQSIKCFAVIAMWLNKEIKKLPLIVFKIIF